jgi:hypothetical protein
MITNRCEVRRMFHGFDYLNAARARAYRRGILGRFDDGSDAATGDESGERKRGFHA